MPLLLDLGIWVVSLLHFLLRWVLAHELKDAQIDEQLLGDEGGNVVDDRRWRWSVVIVCDCDGQCIVY